jgi:hypothetical protein
MNDSIPRDQLSGTPTSARPAATPFKVAMTVALLIALQPFRAGPGNLHRTISGVSA